MTDVSPAHKLFALGLGAVLVGFELFAIAAPREDWPFTAAPMFARHHAPDAPLFEIDVVVHDASGARRVLGARELGLGELSFKRQLFARWYGSTDPRHPGGHHPGDTHAMFTVRMRELLRRLAHVEARRSGKMPRALEVEVRRIERGRAIERRSVVRYEVEERS